MSLFNEPLMWHEIVYPLPTVTKEECETALGPFLNHIYQSWCHDDEVAAVYVLKFLAHIIQKPDEHIGVALVLRGAESTSKSIIVDAIGKLLGHHYSRHQLTIDFQAWTTDCLLMFVDGFNRPSLAEEAPLKALISESTIEVMKKGHGIESHISRIHLIIATNDEWVPEGSMTRRSVVLDVEPCSTAALTESMAAPDFDSYLVTYLDQYVDLSDFIPLQLPKIK